MATAAQKYGGGTISGASAFKRRRFVKEGSGVAGECRRPARGFAARRPPWTAQALPRTCAVHRPTPTLKPPPMSQLINATNGAVNPPKRRPVTLVLLTGGAIRVALAPDNAVKTNKSEQQEQTWIPSNT